jgi:hypothetical protein
MQLALPAIFGWDQTTLEAVRLREHLHNNMTMTQAETTARHVTFVQVRGDIHQPGFSRLVDKGVTSCKEPKAAMQVFFSHHVRLEILN